MKKTPIIAGVVGLGILGGAYLGGLYISGNKAMSVLHRWVDEANRSSGVDYLSLQEDRGLFRSTVHLSAANPTQPWTLGDAQLTFHHGIFSTDIDGKLMLNDPRWQSLPPIKKNGGFDVEGHIKSFSSQGSFVQTGIRGRVDDAKPESEFSAFLRAELTSGFDQGTTDTLRALIAKGMNEQAPEGADGHGDGKEQNILLSVKAHGPKARVDIEMPILYQRNSASTDTSTVLSFRINGEDVLKPYGIESVSGVSHTTYDKYHRGSYARFDIPGKFMLPKSFVTDEPGYMSDLNFQARVDDNGASAALNIAGMEFQSEDSPFSMGPLRISAFSDIDTYGHLMDLSRTLKSMPQEDQVAALKTLGTRLPDIHLELHDMLLKGNDDEDTAAESSLKSVTMDIVRDLSAPVTHFDLKASDINGSGIEHADFSQRITIDQPIINTAISVLQVWGHARNEPSQAQLDDIKQQVLTLLKSSPRIVLNEWYFAAHNFPRPMIATGELSVLGDTLQSLDDLSEKSVKAHVTITGLPDELVSEALMRGLDSVNADTPVEIDFQAGKLSVNGEQVQ